MGIYPIPVAIKDPIQFQAYLKAAGIPVTSIRSGRAFSLEMITDGSLSVQQQTAWSSLTQAYPNPPVSPPPVVISSLSTMRITGSVATVGTLSCNSLSTGTLLSTIATVGSLTTSKLTLPNSLAFTGLYNDLANVPVAGIFSGTINTLGLKVWTGTSTTSGGTATFYPTSDGTSSGTPIFNKIIFASAMPWNNTATVTSMPIISGKSVTNSAIVYNILNPTGSLLASSSSLASAANGLTVLAIAVGT